MRLSKKNKGVVAFLSLMKKRVILVLALCIGLSVSGLSISPSIGYACSCLEPPAVEEALERSKAVFMGKVIEIKEQKILGGGTTNRILFEVVKTWKGESQSQIFITTGQPGAGDCGYDFRKGEEYLVYANRTSIYGYNVDLSTVVCDRTNKLSEAEDDLVLLGEGIVPTEEVNSANELNDASTYIWIIAIVVIGFAGFLVWKRSRN